MTSLGPPQKKVDDVADGLELLGRLHRLADEPLLAVQLVADVKRRKNPVQRRRDVRRRRRWLNVIVVDVVVARRPHRRWSPDDKGRQDDGERKTNEKFWKKTKKSFLDLKYVFSFRAFSSVLRKTF